MNPCPAWQHSQERMTGRTLTIAERDESGWSPGVALHVLAVSLAEGFATDGQGLRHEIPGGCEFMVHKIIQGDALVYYASYSGPERDADAIFAGSPEWVPEDMARRKERVDAARAAYPRPVAA